MKAHYWSLVCLLAVAACASKSSQPASTVEKKPAWLCAPTANGDGWQCHREGERPAQPAATLPQSPESGKPDKRDADARETGIETRRDEVATLLPHLLCELRRRTGRLA